MSLRLRSWCVIALLLVASVPVPTLTVRVEDGAPSCCTKADVPEASETRCHQSAQPSASLACCCRDHAGRRPVTTAARPVLQSLAAPALAASRVDGAVPSATSGARAVALPPPGSTRPLFTLFSTLLI